MIFHVANGMLHIGEIRITGVASSSTVLIGDTQSITLMSCFDTPPESLQIGPSITPLEEEEPSGATASSGLRACS